MQTEEDAIAIEAPPPALTATEPASEDGQESPPTAPDLPVEPAATEEADSGSQMPPEAPSSADASRVLEACTEIRELLRSLSSEVHNEMAQLAPLGRQLLMEAKERDEQERLRQVLYEKLDASKNSFQLQLIRPFVLRLAAMHDLLRDFQQLPDLPTPITQAFGALTAHLVETLAVQGIEVVAPTAGEPFDCLLHYVVKAETTPDLNLHERIVQTVLPGFVYLGPHDRTAEIRPVVLRPARVATWRYEVSTAIPPPLATP